MNAVNSTAVSPPNAPARANDFPDWVPAMLVKELRQNLRAKGFIGAFVVFHLLTALAFWWTIEINSASGLRETFTWLNGSFWALLNIVLLLAVPLRGMGALRIEMENRTLDLLVLTRMSAWRIVVGKWIAIVAQAGLFLVALLPYGMVRYFFGAVDLAGDLVQVGWLFLISCALSAATIWISSMPKVLRIVLPIGLVLLVQSMGMATVLFSVISGRTGGIGATRTPLLTFDWSEFFVISLVGLAFLALAVRRIAPAAENHSAWARGFAFVMFVCSGALLLFFRGFGAKSLLVAAYIPIIVVSAIELARDCLPMGAHWRPFRGDGRVRAAVGRLLLPGWPSAAGFLAVMLVIMAGVSVLVERSGMSPARLGQMAWTVSALAWQALVFPAVLLSFAPARSSLRVGGGGYFVLHGMFGIVSIMSANNAAAFIGGERFAAALLSLCQVLPISSFWLHIEGPRASAPVSWITYVGQAVMLGVMVWLVWRQSRPYWRQLDVLEKRAQAAAVSAMTTDRA